MKKDMMKKKDMMNKKSMMKKGKYMGGLKLKGTNKMMNTIGTKDTGRLSAKKGKKIILGTGNRGTSNLSA